MVDHLLFCVFPQVSLTSCIIDSKRRRCQTYSIPVEGLCSWSVQFGFIY